MKFIRKVKNTIRNSISSRRVGPAFGLAVGRGKFGG